MDNWTRVIEISAQNSEPTALGSRPVAKATSSGGVFLSALGAVARLFTRRNQGSPILWLVTDPASPDYGWIKERN